MPFLFEATSCVLPTAKKLKPPKGRDQRETSSPRHCGIVHLGNRLLSSSSEIPYSSAIRNALLTDWFAKLCVSNSSDSSVHKSI